MLFKIGRHALQTEHVDKIYFPEDGFTKKTLIDYYHGIAYFMLPYIRNRPLMMQRFPLGIHERHFYQKDAPEYFPDWITTVRVKKRTESGSNRYLLCQDTATLVYLATQANITPHCWLSTYPQLNYPDRIIFDIDPPHHQPVDFERIGTIARDMKTIIESHGLTAYIMTTGSRGVHITIPILPHANFTRIRAYARNIAVQIIAQHAHHTTLASSTTKRGDKILIDIMRNAYGATAVAPYALRALPHAPVATPILWEELNTSVHSAQTYTLTTIGERLQRMGDIWHDMHRHRRPLKFVS